MKVACQQCGTAYSVADDKVAGRKVKLRCKHCNEAMIIDGTKLHNDAHDAPTNLSVVANASVTAPNEPLESPFPVQAPADSGASSDVGLPTPVALAAPADVEVEVSVDPATAAWHVAVGDGTQGPYALDELARHYAEGQIASDTLVYYDGASDWQEASEVEALTQAANAFWQKPARPSVPPPPRPEARRFEPVAAPSGTAPALRGDASMGRDPFEERAQAVSPRVSTASMMESRHEGTVQFSIDQIRAISSVSSPNLMPVASSAGMRSAAVGYEATPSYASLAAAGSSAAYGSRPGYAAGGDSGLIDVSAMSAAEPSPFRAIADAQLSPLDTRATPMAVPLHARSSGLDARTKVFAGLSALGFVLAAGVAALALLRTPVAQPVAVAAVQPSADVAQANVISAPVAQPVAAAAPEPAPVAERTQPGAAAPRDDADDHAERAAAPAPRLASRDRGHAASRSSAGAKRTSTLPAKVAAAEAPKEAKEPKAKAAPKPSADSDFDDLLANGPSKKPAAGKGGSPSIDDLLDGAVSAKKQPPKAEPAEAKSDLPAAPSRDAMLASLGKAKAKVGKCKGAGVATADITIAGSGKVSNVAVTGVEGAAKSCVESAVRSTPFPKFQKDAFQVKFPFKLPG